jgi:hypothetical protein
MQMASVTMLDLAKQGQTPLDKRLRYYTALDSPVMGDANMKVISTFSEKYTRHVENFGAPSFSPVGEGFASIVSKNEQLECTTYPVGFNIDIDRRIKSSDQIEDPRVSQLKAGMMGYGAYVSGKIFEGDPLNPGLAPSGNPAPPFKGIKWYLDYPDAEDGAKLSSEMKFVAPTVAGTTIDLRAPISSGSARAFMHVLNVLRYKMYHARAMKRKIIGYVPSEIMIALPSIQLIAGALQTTSDAWGREMYTYGTSIELKEAGLSVPVRNPNDPTTSAQRVLGWEDVNGVRSDTLVAGSGTQFVSIYFVEWGDDALTVASKDGQQQMDLGLLDDGVTKRTQVSDILGLEMYNPWCVSRATGFLVG